MPGSDDARELLRLATDIAREAGRMAAKGQEEVRVEATKSSPTDVVTEMDRACEQLVRDRLRAARPHDAFFGEEDGSVAGTSGVRWIVDPIDGTVNYLYGRHDWAVSIAVEIDGQVVAGVVEAPVRRETYTALLGGGAYCNDARLRVRPAPSLALALVATGFGYASRRRAAQAEVLRTVLPRVRDIRRAGSGALDLCAVALGEVDAYYERGLNPWDWGAAALVAREAGARVAGLHGHPAGTDLLIAAPEELFTPLHDLLASVAADTDDPR